MPRLFSSHFINLTDFIAVFSGGHPEASYAQNKKLRSGREGLLRSARCIVPTSFFFFFVALFSSFYPPLTLIPFFFSLCLSLHLLLNDSQALTASPTDLPVCDLPPLVEPFTGSAEVECLALGG